MAYLSLSPVSVGVFNLLNVAGLTALVSTRIYDDLPQAPTLPLVLYEVQEKDIRGFGTRGLPEVECRVHAFSSFEGWEEAQSIIAKVVELMRDQTITVTGYTQCGRIFYDETVTLPDEQINGVKCKELVALFRIYVEEP